MKLKILLLLVTLAIFGTRAFAASPASVLVDVAPPYPIPYEDVQITLNSYANNLDSVLISWFLNGKNVSAGIGKKSFSLKAPAAGAETTVVAKVSLLDGEVEKRIIIKPGVMVLLWQANDSYVPPFYRGKALATADSEVKVVAMPEIKGVSVTNMTYAWKKDYTNVADAGGYGKNFFIYTNDYLDDSSTISVVATTLDGSSSSEASVSMGTAEPKINFYKNDVNLGIVWERALADGYRIQGPEVIVAIPYFISPKELQHPSLIWNWSINDSSVNISGFKKNIIPVQAQSGVSGTSKLRLNIENREKIFQTASKEVNLEF